MRSHSNNTIRLFFYGFFVVVLVAVYFFFRQAQNEYNSITTYQECIDAGFPMIATYPEQCKIPGKIFVNESQTASVDIIKATSTAQKSYKDATYTIEGQSVTLTNGVSVTKTAPGSVSENTVKYFGNEVRGDFDGSGSMDIAFLLTQNSGGSGTFFYLAVALQNDDHTYTGTNAVLLGDRIAPQTTELKNGEIVVNYANRGPNEPMTQKPSIGVSKHFKVLNGTLVEVTD